MISQGDIILINLDPNKGHEQAGKRPALVISNDTFNSRCNVVILCPITNTDNKFPLHIPLDERTRTSGMILCEHVRTLDLNARPNVFVEKIPDDILENVINVIFAEVEQPE